MYEMGYMTLLSRCVAASPTSLLAAIGSDTGHLRLVDCRQQLLKVLQCIRLSSERLRSVVYSPDGNFVAASCSDRQVYEARCTKPFSGMIEANVASWSLHVATGS